MNRLEAKRFWRERIEKWGYWSQEFLKKVKSIEDPVLQHAVASTIDTIASGWGSVAIRQSEKDTIVLVGFNLDEEAADALGKGIKSLDPDLDPNTVTDSAVDWIKDQCVGTTAVQLAWSFGALREVGPSDFTASNYLRKFTLDHIVYDMEQRRILGVRLDDGSVFKVA